MADSLAGENMPTGARALDAGVAFDVILPWPPPPKLASRGIETYGHDIKLIADVESDRPQRAHEAIGKQRAKVAATIVDKI